MPIRLKHGIRCRAPQPGTGRPSEYPLPEDVCRCLHVRRSLHIGIEWPQFKEMVNESP